MSGMWFLLGVLCGGAVCARLLRRKRTNEAKPSAKAVCTPPKAWAETHNFLYYDGTEMPKIKEDLNEQ